MKPSTQTTMILGYLPGKDVPFCNIILPLASMHIFHTDATTTKLVIELKPDLCQKIVGLNLRNMMVTVSDDPYIEWAGDWAHLGTSRIHFSMAKCEVVQSDKGIEFVCPKDLFGQSIVLAERFTTYSDQIPVHRTDDNMVPLVESYIFSTLDEPILYLKTTTAKNLHASVMNWYERPHVKDTLHIVNNMDEQTILKMHFDGSYSIDENYIVTVK